MRNLTPCNGFISNKELTEAFIGVTASDRRAVYFRWVETDLTKRHGCYYLDTDNQMPKPIAVNMSFAYVGNGKPVSTDKVYLSGYNGRYSIWWIHDNIYILTADGKFGCYKAVSPEQFVHQWGDKLPIHIPAAAKPWHAGIVTLALRKGVVLVDKATALRDYTIGDLMVVTGSGEVTFPLDKLDAYWWRDGNVLRPCNMDHCP